MARDSYKACLARMREEGVTIDTKDEARIDELIDAGMEPMDAIRAMFIQRAANVVDFVGKRKAEGAEIVPYSDTYDAVISRRSTLLARTMQIYMNERNELGQQKVALEAEQARIQRVINWIETVGKNMGFEGRAPGGAQQLEELAERTGRPWPFNLAGATDADVLAIFEALAFGDRRDWANMDNETRFHMGSMITRLELAMGVDTPIEALNEYKRLIARRGEILDERLEVNRKLNKMEERVRAMTDREWRNPDWSGNLDADGNYRTDPIDPDDGVAEQVVAYRAKPSTLKRKLDVYNTAIEQGLIPENQLEHALAMQKFLEAAVQITESADMQIQVPVSFQRLLEALDDETDIKGPSVGLDFTKAAIEAIEAEFQRQGKAVPKPGMIMTMVENAGVELPRASFYMMRKGVGAANQAARRGNIKQFNAVMQAYAAIMTPGVSEDDITYSVTFTSGRPWTVSRGGEGDLYISRHGKNAGTPHKERQGPNDFAITLDQNVLDPGFMYYLFMYLQPEVAGRARGTAQQYVTKSDIDEVLTEYFRRKAAQPPIDPIVREDGGDIYSDPNLSPERHLREADVNYRAINPAKVVLTVDKEISVGIDKITDAADAAHILAGIRKNAQEGFWGIATDDDGNVLGIVEHSKGGIDGTSVYVSVIAGHVLQIPGATKVWWAHNHPSGNMNPSDADKVITKRIEDLMRGSAVEVQGHVLLGAGRDRFTTMDARGDVLSLQDEIRPAARDKKVPVYTRTIRGKNQVGESITDPQSAEQVIQRLGWPNGVVFLNTKHQVVGYMEMTPDEMKNLRNTGNLDRILRAATEMNAAKFIGVLDSVDPDASSNLAALGDASSASMPMLDFFYKDQNGTVRSMAATGQISQQQTFYQDIVGLTSGLLEAAKNIKIKKGNAEQMLAQFRKIKTVTIKSGEKKGQQEEQWIGAPGVKKEEFDWLQLEDWINAKGTVTKDEVIDFIDKNGVVVEEYWLGEETGAIKDPIIDWDRVPYEDLDLSADRYEGMDEADFIDDRVAVFDVQDDANDLYFTVIHDVDAGNVYVWEDDTNTQIPVDTEMNAQNLEDAEAAIRQHIETRKTSENRFVRTPMHTEYTLDGGSAHREVVFRLPHPHGRDTVKVTGRIVYNDDVDLSDNLIEALHTIFGAQAEELDWGRIETDGLIELNQIPGDKWKKIEQMMNQPEWDNVEFHEDGRSGDPNTPEYTRHHAYTDWNNVLMWVRVNERTGPNGERILFVEEIQSDWHQTGQKYGYMSPDSPELLRARAVKEQMEESARQVLEREGGQAYFDKIVQKYADQIQDPAYSPAFRTERGAHTTKRLIREYSNWVQQLSDKFGQDWVNQNIGVEGARLLNDWRVHVLNAATQQREVERLQGSSLSPPDAPFKGNAWAELAMKRMIRLAAEEGFDQVAWTTGEQQNTRYNEALTATVEWVEYDIEQGMLRGGGFGEHIEEYVLIDDLEEYLGEEMADNLRHEIDYFERNYQVVDASLANVTWEDIREEPDAPSDLEQRIDDGEIEWDDTVDDGFVIEIGGSHEESAYDQWYFEDESAAEMAMHQMARDNGDYPTLSGDEIHIGGHGQRAFYDKRLPDITSRVVKKMDKKARVQRFGGTILRLDNEELNHIDNRVRRWTRIVRDLRGTTNQQALEDARSQLIRWQREQDRAMNDSDNRFTVHSVDISPDIQVKAMEGQTLFQDRRRGSITFDEQRRAVIRMTRARDMSTFLHETGHLYLELLGDMAQMPDSGEQVKADYNRILKFLGVDHRSQIKRVHHEKFARAYEAYLREGKAPDPSLRDAFISFGAWLKRIYKRLAQLDVELDDSIRGVFDRMIATDESIKQARQVQNFVELFTTAEDMELSPEAFEVYRKHGVQAHEDAVEREQQVVLEAMLREEQTWWNDERQKMEDQVREEAYAMRVYRALAMLQKGKNPDGTVPETATYKISKASLMRLLKGSQATLNRLPRPYIYTVEGGVDAGLVAKEFGYHNADEMITEIMRSRPMEEFIASETDARMAEQFPDPMTSGELQERALDAVHNDRQAQVMAAEIRALRKKMREDAPRLRAEHMAERREQREAREQVPKRGEIALIKESAKALINKMKVRDVKPHVYLAQERKAGNLAFKAMEKKDYAEAYKYKRQQLVNHEMYRAAKRAQQAAESTRKYLSTFDRTAKRRRMGKGGVLERIDAVLEGLNFRKISLAEVDRQAAQAELLNAIEIGAIVAPPDVIDALNRTGTNYQDLTNLELKGIRDVITQLEMMGKRQHEMIVNGEKQNIQDTANKLAETMREVDEVIPLGVGQDRRGKQARDAGQGFINAVLRPGAIARILDGANFGEFTQKIIVPIRRAYAERMLPMFQKATEDVTEIYMRHYDDKELRQLNNEQFFIEPLGESLTKGEMISVVLNWGSETNRKALMGGKKQNGEQAYSEQAIRVILGKMSANDAAFINEIWEYLDSYWDELSATEKRRRGISPEKVEAMPFMLRTTDGQEIQMRGGYYPLKYDSRHSKRQRIQEFQDVQEGMGNGVYVSSNTRAGATYNRVDNHGKVVRLGLNTIDLHLREIIRDISIGDEVNFVKRVLEDPHLDAAFQETGNQEALKQLKMWLDDSAVGELPASGFIEQALAYTRTGFTKAKIAWNLVTMALQLTGVFQTAAEMGTTNYLRGVGKTMQNPRQTWKFIMSESAFMKHRYDSGAWDKDVADAREHLNSMHWLFGEGPTKARRISKRMARTYFAPIMAMQSQVDASTWMAGYIMAQNDGKSHQDSVLFADARVEAAQTSGFFSDRSGVERGTINYKTVQAQFVRIWTTLISYMLAKFGIAYEKTVEVKRARRKGEFTFGMAVKFSMDMLMLFTLEGIASALIYGNWPDDEDEDESFAWWLVKVSGESALSGVPFVRDSLNARYGGGNTVIGSLSQDAAHVYTQAAQGEIDLALLKAINNVGGTLFHYPSSQTNRLIDSAWREFVEGEDVALYEYGVGRRDND